MADVKELVEYYVARLSGTEREDAWHGLAEAGPAALPHVIAAFQATGDVGVHVNLVRVLAEYRTADAVPFLVGLLALAEEPVWKSALDALVAIGGGAALQAMAKARTAAPPARREWIDEAIDQAVASLIEIADGGDSNAQYDLGEWVSEGEEAVEWFLKAAEQGHVEAQVDLAWRYEGAEGVAPDAERAVKWLRRAAERGHSGAQRDLGRHYADGDGVEQDYEQALRWIRLAADGGNELAQFDLGEMYAAGRGVPRDDVQAAMWWCRAAEHGDDFLQYRLAARYADASVEAQKAMERAMTPVQRAKVQETVAEWRQDFESRRKN
jgi:TPR repeat protein